MKIRDRLPLLAVLCCLFALLLLPEVSAQAARDAMLLCAQTLIPSLFPFFVLSSLLIACGASELLSALLSPLMRPLFGLSGAGAAALALGLCGGYPVGAREHIGLDIAPHPQPVTLLNHVKLLGILFILGPFL